MKLSLKTIFFVVITIAMSMESTLLAFPVERNNSLEILKKEVARLFQKKNVPYPDIPDQEVTVGFMINARKELIVVDIKGDSTLACEYVKQVLNYNKVKFNQAKQLTRYSIKFYLVKEKN